MSEYQLNSPESLYNTFGREFPGGLTIQCENCGTPGNVAITIIHHAPTEVGKIFGLENSQELIYGSPSWNSPNCLPGQSHSWQPLE